MANDIMSFRLKMPNARIGQDTKFEVERSNRANDASNDNSRLMAQASLLTNGSAATAVIAFLTKDNISPIMVATVPWALLFYTLGVVFGAFVLFYMTKCLDRWNEFWEFYARGGDGVERDRGELVADLYWCRVERLFLAAIWSFAFGSLCMAVGLFRLYLRLPSN